ncbi:HNH/endonuclease VII fold putative polymorphic toxin [Pseudomonas kitaguniensis]|uniref:HNH/endonuclease VII fold putative polymorphic toxin n=1 Tax=Pseudomonas kitaguniensis TaxID=2607908 RepID=UPI003D021644
MWRANRLTAEPNGWILQDHSAGHKFGDKNRIGDQGAHFNLRPLEAPRTGNVPGTKDHYSFKDKK